MLSNKSGFKKAAGTSQIEKKTQFAFTYPNSNGNTRPMCEIHSKLTIKTPEWRTDGAFYENS